MKRKTVNTKPKATGPASDPMWIAILRDAKARRFSVGTNSTIKPHVTLGFRWLH